VPLGQHARLTNLQIWPRRLCVLCGKSLIDQPSKTRRWRSRLGLRGEEPAWQIDVPARVDISVPRARLLTSLIASACYDLDEGLRGDASRPTRDGGTTAIIALVFDRHLIVANVGDSRCILARKKKREEDMSAIEVVPMLEDHRRPPRQEVGHQFSECVPRLRRLQLQVER
jgi:hypothetical protein